MQDDRDILELLKAELSFLEKGGYRKGPRYLATHLYVRRLADLYQFSGGGTSAPMRRMRPNPICS
jgi:hypothetical protein